MSGTELLLRLAAATLAGAALGLDREAHQKSAGLRTLALVGLASAIFMVAGLAHEGTGEVDPLRVVQGIVTGVGFLGAGTILQKEDEAAVLGLTTAATIWIDAALGVAFAMGLWATGIIGLGLALLVLVGGRWVERHLRRGLGTER
ncbi:MAG: MgtC/SapB family protein [Vicinamibacterales bacterium]